MHRWYGCHGEEEIKVQVQLKSSKVHGETCWLVPVSDVASQVYFSSLDINNFALAIFIHRNDLEGKLVMVCD